MRTMIRALRSDRRGLALTEFALALPLLTIVTFYGLEMANYAITREQISQLAAQVADNGSRMGDQNVIRNKPISEKEINDLLIGANLQADKLDLQHQARVILSSLELNSDKGQWIHWQRCYGTLTYPSAYGSQGAGMTGTSFPGMGPSDSRIIATKNNAVMFVELRYRYKPIISARFAPATDFTEIAAMYVRDDRDTTQVYNGEDVTASMC